MSLKANSLLHEKCCMPNASVLGEKAPRVECHSAVPQQCPDGMCGSGVAYLAGSITTSRLQDEQWHLFYLQLGLCFTCILWAYLAAD